MGNPNRRFPRTDASALKHKMATLTTTSDRESTSKRCRLLDLPVELVERILDFALIADEPIELAPICPREPYWPSSRPTTAVLRTCKALHVIGTRSCYSRNAFRFSNDGGFFVLRCFLDLIGPSNGNLLRDITVCSPESPSEWNRLAEGILPEYCRGHLPWFALAVLDAIPAPNIIVKVPPVTETISMLKCLPLTSLTFILRDSDDSGWGHRSIGQTDLERLDVTGDSKNLQPGKFKLKLLHLFYDAYPRFMLSYPDVISQHFKHPTSQQEWQINQARISNMLPHLPQACTLLRQAGWGLSDESLEHYDPSIYTGMLGDS